MRRYINHIAYHHMPKYFQESDVSYTSKTYDSVKVCKALDTFFNIAKPVNWEISHGQFL